MAASTGWMPPAAAAPWTRYTPENEGVYALILYFRTVRPGFKKIPESKSKDNVLRRDIEYTIDKDGHINGTARFNYTGNKNISIRSTLKDGSASDMLKNVFLATSIAMHPILNSIA
jgi:hypothetical protein